MAVDSKDFDTRGKIRIAGDSIGSGDDHVEIYYPEDEGDGKLVLVAGKDPLDFDERALGVNDPRDEDQTLSLNPNNARGLWRLVSRRAWRIEISKHNFNVRNISRHPLEWVEENVPTRTRKVESILPGEELKLANSFTGKNISLGLNGGLCIDCYCGNDPGHTGRIRVLQLRGV